MPFEADKISIQNFLAEEAKIQAPRALRPTDRPTDFQERKHGRWETKHFMEMAFAGNTTHLYEGGKRKRVKLRRKQLFFCHFRRSNDKIFGQTTKEKVSTLHKKQD